MVVRIQIKIICIEIVNIKIISYYHHKESLKLQFSSIGKPKNGIQFRKLKGIIIVMQSCWE